MSCGPRCLPGVALSRSVDGNGQNEKPKCKHNPNCAKTKRKALLKNPKESPVKTSLGRLGRQLSGEGLPCVDRALGFIPDTRKTKQANENPRKQQGVVKSFRTCPLLSGKPKQIVSISRSHCCVILSKLLHLSGQCRLPP